MNFRCYFLDVIPQTLLDVIRASNPESLRYPYLDKRRIFVTINCMLGNSIFSNRSQVNFSDTSNSVETHFRDESTILIYSF